MVKYFLNSFFIYLAAKFCFFILTQNIYYQGSWSTRPKTNSPNFGHIAEIQLAQFGQVVFHYTH